MTTRIRRLAAAAVLVLAGALAGHARAASAQGAVQCEKCHGSREFIERRRDRGRADTLMYVPRSVLAQSAHESLACAQCHVNYDDVYPHDARARVVPCETCHEQAGLDWVRSVHKANATTKGDAPQCTGCHSVWCLIGWSHSSPIRWPSRGPYRSCWYRRPR